MAAMGNTAAQKQARWEETEKIINGSHVWRCTRCGSSHPLAATYESLTFMEAHESKHLLEDILSALALAKSAKKSS